MESDDNNVNEGIQAEYSIARDNSVLLSLYLSINLFGNEIIINKQTTNKKKQMNNQKSNKQTNTQLLV